MATSKGPTKYVRKAQVQAAFTPHAPINDLEHFALRQEQVAKCTKALVQSGLHIALFGERGVGKTSLAKMLPALLKAFKLPTLDEAVRIDCNSKDDFRAIWRAVFRKLGSRPEEVEASDFGPEDVRHLLQKDGRKLLIVLDELDRMDDEGSEITRSLLADTLKGLSDDGVNVTIMLVGVADTLDLLIGDHRSVSRSLVDVLMPRMNENEAGDIIDKGFARTDLTINPEARRRIIALSEGLPHFVHLLSQHSGERAVDNDDHIVKIEYVDRSLESALNAHTLVLEYDEATRSPQKANLYEKVLLACAYAPRDAMGYFRPANVIGPMSIILGREVGYSTFQTHLSELSGKRSETLKREGTERNYRFRFRNPHLQAFAKIRALSTGLIDDDKRAQLEALSAIPAPSSASSGTLFDQ